MPDEHRAFSEKEASELLQLAARLQEQESERDYTPGVSYEELVRIAQEAGIDPKYLSKAMTTATAESKPVHWGFAEEFDRVIEGEISPDNFDLIYEVVGRQPMKSGLHQVGKSLRGQVTQGIAMIQLEITSRNGRTRLKAKSIPFIPYFATLHWMGILGIIAGAAVGENNGPVLGAMIGSLMLGLGFLAFYFTAQLSRKKAREVITKMEGAIQEAISLSTSPAVVPPAPVKTPLEERLESLG